MEYEGIQIEYKREFVDNFKYTVIAFANTEGGQIFFGINDDGSVCGITDVDKTMRRITDTVRDTIRPDVSRFTKCEAIEREGKPVIRLTVQPGTARPYYLKGYGIRSEGVYVRQGASSVSASEAAILHMIQESSGFVYEAERSLEQQLTFVESEARFSAKEVEFGEAQKKSLGIIGTDGLFTNVGLLLSDQCPHIIKVAVFNGSGKTTFQNRREFSGSLLKQLDDAFAFLDLCNQTRSEIHGLERIDIKSYPGDAIRETLLNLLVHRDYSVRSPALISVFDDRMEFVSVGGLVAGLSFDDIMLGVSMTRNPRLADVFYRLHLIEAYGTGILKMNEGYADYPHKPKIEVSSHAFKVTLPNVNFVNKQVTYQIPPHTQNLYVQEPEFSYGSYRIPRRVAANESTAFVSERARLLDELFRKQQFVTRKDVQIALATSQPNAVLILRRLLDEGKVAKIGSGKNVCYTRGLNPF